MSRIAIPTVESATGTTAEIYAQIKHTAGYTDQQLAEISLAIAVITFTNTFNRINDTVLDFPAVG